ncbi:MAG: UDP-N-acetylglucosamine--N-acetylmuramyl-(pentapeptide) pyrophosphoryl-undecaprenol N-acetylglucosamine transferase [Candidatus Omnitrophota bacterium]
MKVLFTASASGGHIFPALSVARLLKKKFPQAQILFLTEKNKVSSQILNGCEFEVFFLEFKSKGAFSLQVSSSIIKLLLFSLRIINILMKFSPDYIVGFGGYVSVIPIILGRFLGIRTLIHEQNVLMGKANYLLGAFAERIAVSFKVTQERIRSSKITRKIIYTGLPLRESLKQNKREESSHFFNFNLLNKTILVLGGSSGSREINRAFIKSIASLSSIEKLQIIHISGFEDEGEVKLFYQNHPNLCAKVFPFLQDMSLAYSIADLCISRSGAATIYELSLFKIPAILIPYPYAKAHQFENARILGQMKAAIILREETINFSLEQNLRFLIYDKKILEELRNNFPTDLYFDGAKRLADIILKDNENT